LLGLRPRRGRSQPSSKPEGEIKTRAPTHKGNAASVNKPVMHTHTSRAGQEVKCLHGCGPPTPGRSLKPARRREKRSGVLACVGGGWVRKPWSFARIMKGFRRTVCRGCVAGLSAHQHTKATNQSQKHTKASLVIAGNRLGRGGRSNTLNPNQKQQILLCLLRVCFFSYQCHTHTDTPVSLPDLPLYVAPLPSLPPSLP